MNCRPSWGDSPAWMQVKMLSQIQRWKTYWGKGVISEWEHSRQEVMSPVFTRLKKDGSHRMILNLKKLNEEVSYFYFKLETLNTALKLITNNCYLASIALNSLSRSRTQKAAEVHVERVNISIQCSAKWFGYGPMWIHKAFKACVCITSKERTYIHCFPGWFTSGRGLRTRLHTEHTRYADTHAAFGVCSPPHEICPGAITQNPVTWSDYWFWVYDSHSHW